MSNHAILLVEGESDQKFFATLLKDITLNVSVQPETPKSVSDNIFRNGINPLFARFEKEVTRLLLGSSIQQLAIVIDADRAEDGHGLQQRRRQIIDILKKVTDSLGQVEFSADTTPSEIYQGEIFTHQSGAQIGLWIMHDHSTDGMLENFLIDAVKTEQQQLLLTACNTVKNLGEQQLFKPAHELKAHLSTWLAWQDPPGISTAYAYYKSLFDKEHPNIKALTSWLTRVFQ
ncbi:DUF3226 domain-containing protein [Candidatus Thiothrix anitrata]|uniref:DUF4276 family protein n=1 Tax=Candidatus Thiothrix anitrata TaxID=2823902 RepID=A0ABX7X394_9GAMM|nr:DUF3226 domain-containing protein [Candidatus Thiothrix anitrata]QTR49068.1 hypothetical protein J8380_12385 [Candidatus Thiothrix anitrata]